jgi:hypothetical protein
LINILATNRNASKAADLIKKWKYDINDFNYVYRRLLKVHVRYIYKSTNWDKAEERVRGNM